MSDAVSRSGEFTTTPSDRIPTVGTKEEGPRVASPEERKAARLAQRRCQFGSAVRSPRRRLKHCGTALWNAKPTEL